MSTEHQELPLPTAVPEASTDTNNQINKVGNNGGTQGVDSKPHAMNTKHEIHGDEKKERVSFKSLDEFFSSTRRRWEKGELAGVIAKFTRRDMMSIQDSEIENYLTQFGWVEVPSQSLGTFYARQGWTIEGHRDEFLRGNGGRGESATRIGYKLDLSAEQARELMLAYGWFTKGAFHDDPQWWAWWNTTCRST